MASHCSVKDCSNGTYKLKKWRTNHSESEEPPFKLFPFPTVKKAPEKRAVWIRNINRLAVGSKQKAFDPSKDARVCSLHFIDGKPTEANPNPTESLGYDFESRRKRFQDDLASPSCPADGSNKRRRLSFTTTSILPERTDISLKPPSAASISTETSSVESRTLSSTPINNVTIHDDTTNNESNISTPTIVSSQYPKPLNICRILCSPPKKLRIKHSNKFKTTLYQKLIKTDKKCNFYTNLPSKKLFESLYVLISPYAKLRFKKEDPIKSTNKSKRSGRKKQLQGIDEMLLTLMKLKLGLLLEDLGDRFNISKASASRIFKCWIRAMSICLSAVIYMPDPENVRATLPAKFSSFPDVVAIIDCSEIFIETPSDLELQSATWSDYKHHNTIKFLISVTPNSFITFVSEPYTGRISDKAITNDCGFLDTVPPHSRIMADKGFNIQNECAARLIHFTVPPGRRGTAQMSPSEVKATSKIAKVRILVEQVIRRLKTFRVLASEVPLSMLAHVKDILIVCCGISNMKVSIFDKPK